MQALRLLSALARALFAILGLMLFAQADDDAQREITQRQKLVFKFWEWTNFWGIDGVEFPEASYTPGKRISGLQFYSAEVSPGLPCWGFCSSQMGVCQACFVRLDGVVLIGKAIRLYKGESEVRGFNRFRAQQFMNALEARLGRETLDLRMKIDASGQSHTSKLSQDSRATDQLIRTWKGPLRFPVLSTPLEVLRRKSNERVQALVKKAGAGNCEVLVPYADEETPYLPVVSTCPNESGVQFWRKENNDWAAAPSDWMTDPRIYQRYKQLAAKYTSLKLSHK